MTARIFILMGILLVGLQSSAQEKSVRVPLNDSVPVATDADSARSTLLTLTRPAPPFYQPWAFHAPALLTDFDSWQLHRGFNAQLGLSVTAGFGKYAPRSVGFGQNAAFMYVAPITPRLTVAGGLYVNNLDWGGYRQTEAGVTAMAAYRVNDFVNIYAYGSKRLTSPSRNFGFGLYPYLWDNSADYRYGAGVNVKVGKAADIQLNVEMRHDKLPDNRYFVPNNPNNKLNNGILWDSGN